MLNSRKEKNLNNDLEENESENENENENENADSYTKQKISLFEFNWALDLVQTRNCRVPKIHNCGEKDTKKITNSMFEYNVKYHYNNNSADYDIHSEIKMEQKNLYVKKNEENERNFDSFSVLAPFFDLMNHNFSVNTIFELKYLPEIDVFNSSIESSKTEIIPYLTVRYNGHGMKKGEQVCLNYRW